MSNCSHRGKGKRYNKLSSWCRRHRPLRRKKSKCRLLHLLLFLHHQFLLLPSMLQPLHPAVSVLSSEEPQARVDGMWPLTPQLCCYPLQEAARPLPVASAQLGVGLLRLQESRSSLQEAGRLPQWLLLQQASSPTLALMLTPTAASSAALQQPSAPRHKLSLPPTQLVRIQGQVQSVSMLGIPTGGLEEPQVVMVQLVQPLVLEAFSPCSRLVVSLQKLQASSVGAWGWGWGSQSSSKRCRHRAPSASSEHTLVQVQTLVLQQVHLLA